MARTTSKPKRLGPVRDTHICARLGEKVAQRRNGLGLTQKEVEESAWLWYGFISYLETGRMVRLPLPDVMADLADALETNVAQLLAWAGYDLTGYMPEFQVDGQSSWHDRRAA